MAPPATRSRRHLTNAAPTTKPVTADNHVGRSPEQRRQRPRRLANGKPEQDQELGALLADAENEFNTHPATDIERFRNQILADLRRRYLRGADSTAKEDLRPCSQPAPGRMMNGTREAAREPDGSN
jgi:hypothetical protein